MFFCIFAMLMKDLKENIKKHKLHIAAILALIASYCFFQFAYPYHLIRREQMNLFLFDWDYISQTYKGIGWLSRLMSDFLEQFFHISMAGPLIIALLLTAIGTVVYKICHKHMSQKPSLAVAAILYFCSFMRETGNLYITRYTVATLGLLTVILLILQFKSIGTRLASALVLLTFGVWALGSPYHHNYGKFWGVPRINYDRVIGLDVEVARERWDKVLKLSKKDLYMVEASYCYNLAHAMKGTLGQKYFNHSQNGDATLLLRVAPERTIFNNCLAGEAWFHLGSMTIAEQSAIIALQASPKHTGARFIVRLAQVNLISGEDAAAQKYLNMLSKTLFYRKWAKCMMPGLQDESTRTQLEQERSKLTDKDFVHHSNNPRTILIGLLDANPTNNLARNYLLCYDLLTYNLDLFMEDYAPNMIKAHIYHEAVLIWLSQHNRLTEQNIAKFGIDKALNAKMQWFFRNPDNYKDTYWYYYMNALEESEQ